MRYSLIAACWLLLHFLLFTACGSVSGGSSLDGSVKTILNVDYEEVQIKLFGDAVRIQYLKTFQATTENDIVAEVTVSTLNTALTTKTDIPFKGNATLDRLIHKVSASGVLIEDSTQEFPPVFDGLIFFNELSVTPGEPLSGRFSVTFNSGLVMSGEFSGKLLVDDST